MQKAIAHFGQIDVPINDASVYFSVPLKTDDIDNFVHPVWLIADGRDRTELTSLAAKIYRTTSVN